MQYHIWTLGCQMNVADSQLLASELEKLGHHSALQGEEADIMVVNTCVVRQSAEDKGLGRLHLLNKIKQAHPQKVIGVMGCMVGVRDPLWMRQRLPFVDVFMPPSPIRRRWSVSSRSGWTRRMCLSWRRRRATNAMRCKMASSSCPCMNAVSW